MRVLVGLLVLIAVMVATPQTSVEFHARYGKPDVERFAVLRDITLSVEYGENGQACAMRIESRHVLFHSSLNDAPASLEAMTMVLNDVVPPEERGKELGPGPYFWGACHGALAPTEYENLTVNIYYGICEKLPKVHGLDVHFKRPGCERLQPRRIPKS